MVKKRKRNHDWRIRHETVGTQALLRLAGYIRAYGMFLCNSCQFFEKLCIHECSENSISAPRRDRRTRRKRFQRLLIDMSTEQAAKELWETPRRVIKERTIFIYLYLWILLLTSILKSLIAEQDVLSRISYHLGKLGPCGSMPLNLATHRNQHLKKQIRVSLSCC